MKASTTAGSNYVPLHLTISFMASSFEYFGLQGLSEVSASKVSASVSGAFTQYFLWSGGDAS